MQTNRFYLATIGLFIINGYLAANNLAITNNIEIVGGANNNKITVLVKSIAGSSSVATEIVHDLNTTGEFIASTDPKAYIYSYIISANLNNHSPDATLQYQLINSSNKTLLNQTARFNINFLRKAIHLIDNNIYQNITGTLGVFTSKIALAVEQPQGTFSIVVADYDGYNAKAIISAHTPFSSLAWNDTGDSIGYVSYEHKKPIIYVQNLVTNKRYMVANFDGSNSSPVFVPHTNQLAVTLSKDYGSQIYLIPNAPYGANTKAKPLVHYGSISTEADISEQGDKVLFTSDHDGGPQIFLTNILGESPVRITQGLGQYNTSAKFSHDGNKIVFVNQQNGEFSTYLLDLKTNNSFAITKNEHHDLAPSFSLNNKLILLSSDNALWISNISGTTQTKITNLQYFRILDQAWK